MSVDSGGLEENKIYGTYEYFGEVALVTEQNRAADVYAETDVVVYTVPRDKFLNFIVGTEFERTLLRLARIRNSDTWNLLSTSKFFQYCTSSQKTWLESIFIPLEKTESGVLISEGDQIEFVYIIQNGIVEVSRNGKKIAELGKGDFVGGMQKVHRREPSNLTFSHTGPVSLYAMKRDDVYNFLEYNPGLLMKFVYDFS